MLQRPDPSHLAQLQEAMTELCRTPDPELLAARYRAIMLLHLHINYLPTESYEMIDAAVVPLTFFGDLIREELDRRGHTELSVALLRERDALGVVYDQEMSGGVTPSGMRLWRSRAQAVTDDVDLLIQATNPDAAESRRDMSSPN